MDGPETRKQPGVARAYANDRIEVTWAPERCIHVANCIARLPAVFDPMARPWVAIDAAPADDIAATVMTCPTGALHFRRLDGGPQEPAPDETTVTVTREGPLLLRGRVRITAADGEAIREDTRVALCRCGGSADKPFCDGTHRRTGFRG